MPDWINAGAIFAGGRTGSRKTISEKKLSGRTQKNSVEIERQHQRKAQWINQLH